LIVSEFVPEAYLDALAIINEAPDSVTPISVTELHLFCYLACVVALFRGNPISDWGYSFAITSEGFPFSADLEKARQHLYRSGVVDVDSGGLMAPRRTELTAELGIVLTLRDWSSRRDWLKAAVDCALALPIGAIRHAVTRSPGVETPFLLGQRSHLLNHPDVELLYEEYKIVSSVLGPEAKDALSPAVLWLSARILREDEPLV
jgi:hypothetical protein